VRASARRGHEGGRGGTRIRRARAATHARSGSLESRRPQRHVPSPCHRSHRRRPPHVCLP
jgi:hypothetical protein